MLGLLFFKEPNMVNSLSHSCNASDEITLHHLDQQMELLTLEQKATIAIASLYIVIKPRYTNVSLNTHGGKFLDLIESLLRLSDQGKLAVVRAIAEELAVGKQLSEVRK